MNKIHLIFPWLFPIIGERFSFGHCAQYRENIFIYHILVRITQVSFGRPKPQTRLGASPYYGHPEGTWYIVCEDFFSLLSDNF